MAHTPGPWTFLPGDVSRVVRPDGSNVCNDESYYPTSVDPDDMPLIAAAPEMLAALQSVVAEYSTGNDLQRIERFMRAISAANAAITKATGHQG